MATSPIVGGDDLLPGGCLWLTRRQTTCRSSRRWPKRRRKDRRAEPRPKLNTMLVPNNQDPRQAKNTGQRLTKPQRCRQPRRPVLVNPLSGRALNNFEPKCLLTIFLNCFCFISFPPCWATSKHGLHNWPAPPSMGKLTCSDVVLSCL
jgi:hypothetical protein